MECVKEAFIESQGKNQSLLQGLTRACAPWTRMPSNLHLPDAQHLAIFLKVT